MKCYTLSTSEQPRNALLQDTNMNTVVSGKGTVNVTAHFQFAFCPFREPQINVTKASISEWRIFFTYHCSSTSSCHDTNEGNPFYLKIKKFLKADLVQTVCKNKHQGTASKALNTLTKNATAVYICFYLKQLQMILGQ